MDPRIMKAFSDHLLLGGAVVAAGSAAGLWLPFGAAVFLVAGLWSQALWNQRGTVSGRAAAPRLRYRARAWSAAGWAVAAGAVLHAIVPLTIAAATVALFLALRQADYMALGAAERQLPPEPRMAMGDEGAPAALPRRPD